MRFEHLDIDNEMVKKIIKASFEIFASYDYKKASTNMIVQKAGVSRGILYHYFKDKEELFDYLNYYSFEKGFEEIDRYLDWENNDIIKRISDLTKYRLDVIAKYPYMIEFGEKYKEQIFQFTNVTAVYEWKEKFYKHNIDYSLFKEDIVLENALHILKWTFRGLYKELLKNSDEISESVILHQKDECDTYYELLVSSFYRGRF